MSLMPHSFRVGVARLAILASALLSFAGPTATAQSVVYREIFGNTNTSSPISIDNAGWLLARGNTGLLDYATAASGLRRATFTGNPTDLAAVNSSLNPSSTLVSGAITGTSNLGSNTTDTTLTTGYFIRGTTSAGKSLMYTSEYAIDRGAQEVSTISFYLGSVNTADTVRIAAQIGSSWYVSSATFANTSSFVATTPSTFEKQTFTWSTAASAWNSLDFVAGSTLAMGGALGTALPAGSVTAFGLYYDFTNQNLVSFDTYEIQTSAIPEPGTYAAAAGLVVLFFTAYKRRRAVSR